MTRKICVWFHRYVGLAMTVFLIIVGLTGSLLAFYSELEHLINPQFFVTVKGLPRLSAAELIKKAQQTVPEARMNGIWLGEIDSARVSMSSLSDSEDGDESTELGFNQLILNPYTGEELGRRTWGELSEGRVNLMPFVYKLHYNLALDKWGMWILGITALVWTIDCFVAFYLTLPAGQTKTSSSAISAPHPTRKKGFWSRWSIAWKIKWRGSFYRINFDLHRAGGLWLWIALLIFAWSSVYMNLWDTVYTWTTRAVFEYKAPWTELPDLDKPLIQPRIGWSEAEKIGVKLITNEARKNNFTIERLINLGLNRQKGVYVYNARTSKDIQDHHGRTRVFFDANTGEQKLVLLPTGQYNGNTVTSWLFALHMANVFGLPYRIFVCLLGLVITLLCVTGVVIWLKKRRARQLHKRKQRVILPTLNDINAQFDDLSG